MWTWIEICMRKVLMEFMVLFRQCQQIFYVFMQTGKYLFSKRVESLLWNNKCIESNWKYFVFRGGFTVWKKRHVPNNKIFLTNPKSWAIKPKNSKNSMTQNFFQITDVSSTPSLVLKFIKTILFNLIQCRENV